MLARVDGEAITDAQFKTKIQALPKELRAVALKRRKEFLEDMAAEHYLLKEAARRGVDKLQDVRDVLEAARRKIIVAKLIEIEVDKKVSVDSKEAQDYYETHKEEFMTPLLLKASHILVKTEEEAKDIKTQLDLGSDFEELARTRSVDTTAKRGGDLGFFQKGQFVPEFEDKAFEMTKGQVSEPVKSRFGYHIIKLTDRVAPSLRDFDSVKSRVEERLLSEKKSKAFKELIGRLKGNAQMQIDEKALDAVQA